MTEERAQIHYVRRDGTFCVQWLPIVDLAARLERLRKQGCKDAQAWTADDVHGEEIGGIALDEDTMKFVWWSVGPESTELRKQ